MGGSPVVSSEFSEFSCRCRKLNENSLSLLEFWKWGIAMHCELKKPLQCNFSVKIPCIEHLYIAVHNSQEGPLKRTDKRRPLKCKENWRKLLLLGIQAGDKLAKPPFFVAYSWLCHPCRNLTEGGRLLSQFHFTLCRYFLCHVICWNLPWRDLNKYIYT